jgi:hypothetical protein
MEKGSSFEIVLSGGLGNQLFLLSVGLFSKQDNRELFINCSLGNPRTAVDSKPDLLSFRLPGSIVYKYPRSGKFLTILHLFLLKISSKQYARALHNRLYLKIKDLIVLTCNRFIKRGIFLSDGNGFDARLEKIDSGRKLIGNFHTYRYASMPKVQKQMQKLSLNVVPNWVKDLQAIALENRPIVVQIRRGDYLTISELGILESNFFVSALSRLVVDFPESEIWIFSDDFTDIFDFIPLDLHKRARLIDMDVHDAGGNLEAMREGGAYIISNSTFGWWGAFLSKASDPVVLCPQNWFKTLPNPNDLIPLNWIPVPN